MAFDEHSFRHLLPTFLISPGTQVVLRVDKPLPDGSIRQRGSVAESPPDNQYAYTLRFADGGTVKAYFRELAIRRKEVEDQLVLTGEDLRPYIIYSCQVGSRAFGLATADSDDDIRGSICRRLGCIGRYSSCRSSWSSRTKPRMKSSGS